MQLPYSDELNIGYLSRLFDNTSNCYKFFWFQAILKKVSKNRIMFTFRELIDEMIADAWYMVTEYHLRLGPLGVTDNLEEVVKYIFSEYQFLSSEKRTNIIHFLQTTNDKKIQKFKSDLTLNVPYRLQVPFYDEIVIEKQVWYSNKKNLTDVINSQKRLMYYFEKIAGLDTVIRIEDTWAEYLEKHKDILKCWAQLKLIQYLQNKNPSVPGIAEKIEPPVARDINRVRKYWGLIVQIDPSIKDIYGDIELVNETISVDHFVPWQYVAHDELWNLHPTTRSINSMKSNSLPSWKIYFEPLGELEYRAYELVSKNEMIRKEFEKIAPYHLNNLEIRTQLYANGLDCTTFKNRLEKVVKPVYDSAKLQGFREWIYS